MENFIKNIQRNIESEIERIGQSQIDRLLQITQIVDYLTASVAILKSYIAEYQFKSPQEEILFFKIRKPQITSLLVFYVWIYHLEINRIEKTPLAQYKYLRAEQARLNEKFRNNHFYTYYQSGKTECDDMYFLRENYTVLSDIQCLSFDKDFSFSTLHDQSVADILASIRLAQFISIEIDSLSEKLHAELISIAEGRKLQWTDSKVALVELVYALYAVRCLDNGNSSLRDIAFCFEVLFHIEMGDFYRVFLEIRNRKKNRTQFIDKLKDAMVKMMDELDK